MSDLSGTVIGSKYKLLSKICRGGFSTVYRAELVNSESFEVFAVKIIAPKTAKTESELKISLNPKLKSPNIAEIFDGFEEAEYDRACLIMKYYEKGDLQKFIDYCTFYKVHISEEHVKFYALQILAGLATLEANGLFHRDLKPMNVLVDDEGGLRLGDFGLTKPRAEAQNPTQVVVWSPGYSSPEYIMNEPLDPKKNDIFSLGVILHQLMTEPPSFPFNPTNFYFFLEAVRKREFISKIPRDGRYSPALIELVDQMLSYSPSDRPGISSLLVHPSLQPNPLFLNSLSSPLAFLTRISELEKGQEEEKAKVVKERREKENVVEMMKKDMVEREKEREKSIEREKEKEKEIDKENMLLIESLRRELLKEKKEKDEACDSVNKILSENEALRKEIDFLKLIHPSSKQKGNGEKREKEKEKEKENIMPFSPSLSPSSLSLHAFSNPNLSSSPSHSHSFPYMSSSLASPSSSLSLSLPVSLSSLSFVPITLYASLHPDAATGYNAKGVYKGKKENQTFVLVDESHPDSLLLTSGNIPKAIDSGNSNKLGKSAGLSLADTNDKNYKLKFMELSNSSSTPDELGHYKDRIDEKASINNGGDCRTSITPSSHMYDPKPSPYPMSMRNFGGWGSRRVNVSLNYEMSEGIFRIQYKVMQAENFGFFVIGLIHPSFSIFPSEKFLGQISNSCGFVSAHIPFPKANKAYFDVAGKAFGNFGTEFSLKKGNLITAEVDMGQRSIAFRVNEKRVPGCITGIPQKVKFAFSFYNQVSVDFMYFQRLSVKTANSNIILGTEGETNTNSRTNINADRGSSSGIASGASYNPAAVSVALPVPSIPILDPIYESELLLRNWTECKWK